MLPPATWYPDPSGRHEHRYWDGDRWTEHVADAGIADVDPLTPVTADEQVDGGVAADIAAVAMASTSTVGDVAGDRLVEGTDAIDGRSGWAPAPHHADGVERHLLEGDDTTSEALEHLVEDVLDEVEGLEGLEAVADGQEPPHEVQDVSVETDSGDGLRGPAGDDEQAVDVDEGPGDEASSTPDGAGPLGGDADRSGAPVGGPTDGATDEHGADGPTTGGDDRDAWAAASAIFVMPPDTVADLRRSRHHAETPTAEPPPVVRPTFSGVDRVLGVPNIAGGLGHRGATLRLSLDGDTDALVAPAAMRRVDGTIELSPTTSSWADHLTGTGTVELAGSSDVVVVGLDGTQRATLAIESVLALDAASTIEIAMVDGAWEWALVAVESATWMALVAGPEPAVVEVTTDAGPVTVAQEHVVGWTDGLTVTVEDDDLTAEGDGHLLVRGSTD